MAGTGGRAVRLNTDTGFLKLFAMATMLIDHAGKMFFPQIGAFRIIGRIAFPLYCYCVAVGCVYTKNPVRYALRLLALAVISQPIYVLALAHTTPAMNQSLQSGNYLMWYVQSLNSANVLFGLFLGLTLLIGIREKKYILSGVCVLAAWYFNGDINYGWKGVALIVLFYAFVDRPLTSLVWVAGYMIWWGWGGSYALGSLSFNLQIFALMALPLIYIPTNTGFKAGKWLFYLFYPAHLTAIYLLDRFRWW